MGCVVRDTPIAFFLISHMIQYLFSTDLRYIHPWYVFPSPHESTWTECQAAECNAEEGTRFLVRRDYDADGATWIIRDYVLTKASQHVFGGWTKQLVAYYVHEKTPYAVANIRLRQPIRFSQHVPEWGITFSPHDWENTVRHVLLDSGAFS